MTAEEFLLNARFADAFDIVIVSVLIGALLQWWRRRRNPSIFLASVIVGAVAVAAFAFDLYMTRFVLETTITVLLFAVIVLFQQELRYGLDRLLSWRPLTSRTMSADETTIDSVERAVELMSAQRIGALLVFPGKQPIERHCRAGHRVDAEVSVELLHSIFHPQSKGHDGAVTISGNRIERIGVHLPLSTDLTKIASLGTRHCAALGLSERSDAIVCVVSEETGVISLAVNGSLSQVDESTSLTEALRELRCRCSTHSSTTGRLSHRELLEHAAISIASVLLSVALWFTFAFEIQTIQQTIVDVPIELHNVPDSHVVDGPYPANVNVALVGPKRAFDLFDARALKVVVELKRVSNDEAWVTLDERNLKIPTARRLQSVEPQRLRYRLRRVEEEIKR